MGGIMPAPMTSTTVFPPRTQHPDRRRSPRRPHVVQAVIASPTSGERLEIMSVDISSHGVGLRLADPIASGTFHVLELGLGPQQIVTEVRIVSCERQEDGSYRAHAAFC